MKKEDIDRSKGAEATRKALGYTLTDITDELAEEVRDKQGRLAKNLCGVWQGDNSNSPFASMFSGLAKQTSKPPKIQHRPTYEDILPPGFPFWDIPTTLMVTDIKVIVKLVNPLYRSGNNPYKVLGIDPKGLLPNRGLTHYG